MSFRPGRTVGAPLGALFCSNAAAHSFGNIYTLPIPFWMYAFSASAALVLSFVVVGYFVSAKSAARNFRTFDLVTFDAGAERGVVAALQALSVFALLLTMLTGLFGSANPFTNFSVTFFWIFFVLGFTYVTALVGDIYRAINPWRAICDWIERARPGTFRPRLSYPTWLGYYPALAFYMAFIWLELFSHASPRGIGLVLLAYSAINLGGAAVFGREPWFKYGELFGVLFRLIGKIAPFECKAGKIRLRQPFVGLLTGPADHFSLLLLVLFMLSSTAFDGVHQTLPWVSVFWKWIYPLLTAMIDQPYLFFVDIYYYWQWAMLFASPFFYLAIYLVFVWLMKLATGSRRSVRDLALQFTFALIPIAFVYNVTHYFTLLFSQAPAVVPLISDPFGFGWNLFGTARVSSPPIILSADFVWHAQVALILVGHVVSVYLAHAQALQLFPREKQAVWSQLPMLTLMVLFTTVGLWILSLPIAGGQVQAPGSS
jgi:hypothetical protein